MLRNERQGCTQGTAKKKPWPKNCPWPEPTVCGYDYDEDTAWGIADDETQELLEIKEYFDSLVDSGRLNEDPAIAMRSAFSYHFTNENLLRQAEGYFGWGTAKSKVKAKKKAAYMVIVNMLISAGICEDEWHDKMVENMTSRE